MGPETTRLAPAAAEGAGHPHMQPCPLCDPAKDCKGEAHGWLHRFALIRVVGAGLTQPVVARLKENLPLLAAAVRTRSNGQPQQAVFQEDDDRVEVWDADDFASWETLDWPTVRVGLPPTQTK